MNSEILINQTANNDIEVQLDGVRDMVWLS